MKDIPNYDHIKVTYVTHFYCDKEDSINALYRLLETFATYSKEVLDQVHFVLVDDCSSIEVPPKDFGLNITWLKITDDIPWNNPGARNLGVTYAKSDNIVITDTDHLLPEDTLAYLCTRGRCGRNFYKFRRRRPDGSTGRGHSNLFFMSRGRFMELFGYDEQFCGHYAHDDMWFVKFKKWHGCRQMYLPAKYKSKLRRDITKGETHSLNRDQSINTALYEGKRKETALYGDGRGHSRNFLDFNWKILHKHNRPAPTPKENKLWQKLWWFRILNPFG